MSILELKNVSKSYGDETILENINFSMEKGEFVAILGFSGSGKTTLIQLIAGLLDATEGELFFKGEKIKGCSTERGLVFQSYSLMPWGTVDDNVAMSVNQVYKDKSKAERKEIVDHYVKMVGLDHAKIRRPAELSGGMRQRVNVARALSMKPDLLLLDEPLSALDALTRSNLQDEILTIWGQEKQTVILITNDVDEAIYMADRIIPLTPGPNATLGPHYKVDIPRPRSRTELNTNPEFIRLRAEITEYLMNIGMERGADADDGFNLPNVVPLTVTKGGLKSGHAEAKEIGAKIAAGELTAAEVMGVPANDPDPFLASGVSAIDPNIDPELPEVAKKASAAQTTALDKYVEFFETTKIYPTPKGPLTVVDKFNLNLKKGEFISLIGHSGCGKSTVLSMCAGLNPISDGGIVLDGREISDAGPDRGVVFQAPSLFPWLTAYENVSLGVERVYPHTSKAERKDIIEYYLARVGLSDAMQKKASDLSSGMQQRVGIARAFALSPKFLLLDEPFGMLDSLTRWELQEVLMEVWQRTRVTAVCVTHDVDEAILLADRVIMMTNGPNARVGKIMEVDLPRPRTRAQLINHPDYYKYREQLLTFLEEYETGPHKKSA